MAQTFLWIGDVMNDYLMSLLNQTLEERKKDLKVDKFVKFRPSNTNINKLFDKYESDGYGIWYYDCEDEEYLNGRDPLAFNNWIDIVDMKQCNCDYDTLVKYVKDEIKHCRSKGTRNNRWWYAETDHNTVIVFYFGRDILLYDCWFVWLKKPVRKK